MSVAYKHIEACFGEYIARNYHNVIEIGVGQNAAVAERCVRAGLRVRATDIREPPLIPGVEVRRDDVFTPEHSWYAGADLIYAVRPGVEMIPPLIDLARSLRCDLIVYHLGNEVYLDGGEVIECGIVLHRYVRS
ncbi:UPF0146 family protein [Methanofollis fontis]|uniref:UPF0146 protein CUJ86_04655 n=1 Tax=Methanofollis fontis TaxID=2052832 RepID=A0A483CNG1_9EURY|nr:UPF0146 family protein [Methanofollis fontis]TAJ44602.1 hypothetical protein CUJ86_04655 [Methanofollis fontis]